MPDIRFSVGSGGVNRTDDVATIQKLLNSCIGALTPYSPLVVDGLNGDRTEGLIAAFQRRVVGMSTPGSRVDPHGETLKTLLQSAKPENPSSLSQMLFSPPGLCFPLKSIPEASYKTGMRRFGAGRSGGTQNGSLTNRNNKPYQRRRDLMDPTEILDEAKKCLR